MRIVSLFSSSKANCTYIENNGVGVLVDVGCSFKGLCEGLSLIGRDINSVRAVFITHEHTDHVNGLLTLTKQRNVPVYGSEGTLSMIIERGKAADTADLRLISEIDFAPVNMDITAFHTPHDSAESVCYSFASGDKKASVCYDLGHVTQEVSDNLKGSRFVLIESNYDAQMLTRNLKYPPELKTRIRSDRGHLSNGDCAAFVRELVHNGTVSVMLGHLSQENNTPETAYRCVCDTLAASGAAAGTDYILNVAEVRGTGRTITI